MIVCFLGWGVPVGWMYLFWEIKVWALAGTPAIKEVKSKQMTSLSIMNLIVFLWWATE